MRLRPLLLAVLLAVPAPAVRAEEQPPTPHYFSIRVEFDCFGCGAASTATFSGRAIGGGVLADEPFTDGAMAGVMDYSDYACPGIGMMYGRFVFAGNEWDVWWQFHSPAELLVVGHDDRISIIGPAALVLDAGEPVCGAPATGTMTAVLGIFPYPGP